MGDWKSPYGSDKLFSFFAEYEASLTEEEKMEREERRLLERNRILVINGICPNCESKLSRGKKDKKLDYKRVWACEDCSSRYVDTGYLV